MAKKKTTSKKSTQQLLAEALKAAESIQKQAPQAVSKVKEQAAEVQAASEVARNAIQGFAVATGSGIPPRTPAPANIPFIDTFRPATPKDMPFVPGITALENKPPAPPSAFPSSAFDAFKRTLALLMGEKEANKAYISSLFNKFYGYQKQGIPDDTALNFVLRDARTDESLAPFRTRFRAILALEDMRTAGKIVDVPTIQEYIKSEEALGDLLNRAELGDLATEDNIAEIFSKGKSVKEAGDIIATVSSRVKNAPLAVRQQWQALYPTMTDAQLTKALLLGPKGAAEIERQAKGLDIRGAAAEAKSLMPTQAEAEQLAAKGYTYGTTLKGFQNIAGFFPQAQMITERFKQAPLTAQEAMAYEFSGDAAAKKRIEQISALESAGFQKRAGTSGVSLSTPTQGLI